MLLKSVFAVDSWEGRMEDKGEDSWGMNQMKGRMADKVEGR